LRRPDFTHYVIDIMPDFVTAKQDDGQAFQVPAIQVWVDPKYPDAHLDPELRLFLARRGEEDGAVAIIRYDSGDGFVLIPPCMTSDGNWMERRDGIKEREHTAAEKHRVLGDMMVRAVTQNL
jgi:hypothetical protein